MDDRLILGLAAIVALVLFGMFSVCVFVEPTEAPPAEDIVRNNWNQT